jgi:hypothetical protein
LPGEAAVGLLRVRIEIVNARHPVHSRNMSDNFLLCYGTGIY